MKRPITLKLAAIFMLVLALAVGGLAAARQFGLVGGFFGGPGGVVVSGRGMPGNFEGRVPGEGPVLINPGEGGELPEITQGGEGPSFEVVPGDGSEVMPRTFPGGGGTRIRQAGGFPAMAWLSGIQNWLGIGLGLLGLLAAFLLWKPSRWGIVLSVILGALILLTSLPSLLALPVMFRFPIMALWTVVPALLQVGLAVLVIVLALLPASRLAVSRRAAAVVEAEGDEQVERVVL